MSVNVEVRDVPTSTVMMPIVLEGEKGTNIRVIMRQGFLLDRGFVN